MKLDDLPERLRAVCEGRTVVKVHPVDSGMYLPNPPSKSSVRYILCKYAFIRDLGFFMRDLYASVCV